MCLLSMACGASAGGVANYKPERQSIDYPRIGAIRRVTFGEDIMRQGSYTQQKGVVFAQVNRIDRFAIQPGFYPQIGEDGAYTYHSYRTSPPRDGTGWIPAARDAFGAWSEPPRAIRITKGKQQTCLIFNKRSGASCESNVPFERIEKTVLANSDLQRKLIYEGRSGNKLLLRYWEKSGHPARPEHSETVRLKVTVPGNLSYRGAHIRILEADAKAIRYVVQTRFKDYWKQARY